MTQDEQLDRLERSLKLFLKRPVRKRREARVTAAKLGAYLTALREYDVAKLAIDLVPGDPKATQTLIRARETLERARGELKRQNKTQLRRFPDSRP